MSRKKTRNQVAAIEETQRAAESAMEAVTSYLRKAKKPSSEKAHAIIDKVLSQLNCESPQGHIVAGGLQAAEPHERGTGLLRPGVPIVIDIFPRSKKTGYFADMSRTVCIDKPSKKAKKMYDAVLAAQELGISMVKPGVECRSIQDAIEKFFAESGFETSGKGKEFPYSEGFVHGLGHGVGLDIHEGPRIGRKTKDVLAIGDVVTIEPGLYYKKIGGVRIEDLVVVTKKGCRNLTQYGKEFIL